jgi:phage terminase large subunit-like protein
LTAEEDERDWLDGAGPVDAPPPPSYEDAPEEALDDHLVTPADWKRWPLWAKMRLLRRLRTEGAGRPEQYVDPTLQWYIWCMSGGRGSGKSDEASRWSAEDALRLDRIRFALVGRTFADVRDTMFEGETGLLALIPDEALLGGSRERAYNRSLGELFLANGSKFKGFSSEKANQLRGPQHHRAWIDEASSWADAEVPLVTTKNGSAPAVDTTMSNLMLGLRLKPADGSKVRMVSSTTPKPNELTDFLFELAEKKGVVRTLSTYSNLGNLDEMVADVIVGMYEGTDVAAQELEGKRLSAVKGAAWDDDAVAKALAAEVPAGADVEKTVVSVDPAVSSKTSSDETGLVAGRRLNHVTAKVADDGSEELSDDHWIEVLEDRSGVVDVGDFGRACIGFVEDVEADELLVEINNGYDFVVSAVTTYVQGEGGAVVRRARQDRSSVRSRNRQVIEYICETASGHSFVLKPVWQSVDKLTRAKAASVWWHRGRARHAQDFPKLQRQMTTFDGTAKKSPDRVDALTAMAAGLAVVRRRGASGGGSPLAAASSAHAPAGAAHPLLATAGGGSGHPLLSS